MNGTLWATRYTPQPEVSNGVPGLDCGVVCCGALPPLCDGVDGGLVTCGAGWIVGAAVTVGATDGALGVEVLLVGALAATVATGAGDLVRSALDALTRATCSSSTAGAGSRLVGTAAIADPS
jgi:hypothetical protein